MATSIPPLPLDLGHVCMNHFAVLDLLGPADLDDQMITRLAERVCRSQIADDLLVMTDCDHADFRLRVFGADGREGDCCGNGLLLAASLYAEKFDKERLEIDMCGSNREAIRQELGWSVDITVGVEQHDFSSLPEHVDPIALVRAGEPHLVIRAPRDWGFFVRRIDFEAYCRPLRYATGLEGGVNVTMVFGTDAYGNTLIRTFERGAGRQTYSCGTGSTSAIAALFGTPTAPTTHVVCSPGGNHQVEFDGSRWTLYGCPHPIGRGEVASDTIRLPIDGLFDANLYPDD